MILHPFLPQKKLFKAYDIRGEWQYFTDDFIVALVETFAQLFKNVNAPDVAIGYDVRHGSEQMALLFKKAIEKQGIKIHWLGQVTTPIMAFVANQYSGNGVMITASHSEKHINGIKWLVNHESPSSTDIQQLFANLVEQPLIVPNIDQQTVVNIVNDDKYFKDYQQEMLNSIQQINQFVGKNTTSLYAPQRLVIDCLNGATSRFAQQLFSSFGYDCVMLNDVADGNFPKGNPDPTEFGRLHELSQAVVREKADLGLAFDGDGDRLMVIDNHGQLVSPDNLLFLLANLALEEVNKNEQMPAEVIFDVKCSHHIPALLNERGAVAIMEKTGSSLMRKSLQNQSRFSIFAGELSGHFLFNDGYFVLHDDAMYAGVRLLNWLQRQPLPFQQIIENLPTMISTADMYLPITSAEQGQTLVNQLIAVSQKPFHMIKHRFAIRQISTIDGLRLDFANGFGILRKSNTGNFLTVRFAGNNLQDLQQIQQFFVKLCQSVDKNLAEQVASIQPAT